MADSMSDRRFSIRTATGVVACRILVPAWIAAGAATKLLTADPGLLPRNTVLRFAATRQIDFDLWLSLLVSAEFIGVCIMLFLARFAKPMAILMLATFCVILIIEIRSGAKSCGCLGRFSPPPWQMLTADAVLLALVLFGRNVPLRFERGKWFPYVLAVVGSVILTVVTFYRIMPPPEPAFVHADRAAPTMSVVCAAPNDPTLALHPDSRSPNRSLEIPADVRI